MNIAEIFEARVRERPHAVAVIVDDAVLSFAAVDRAVRRIAASLLAQGAAPGDVVGLSTGQSALHLAATLAIARIGAASVPMHPAIPARVRTAICDRHQVKLVAFDHPRGAVEGRASLRIGDEAWSAQGAPVPSIPCAPGGGRPWRIVLTSGTTGVPKGIVATHERWLQSSWMQAGVPELAAAERMLVLMDLHMAAGLRPCLRQLLAGKAVVLVPGAEPGQVFAAIDRYGVGRVQITPGGLQTLVDAAPGDGVRCPGVEQFLVVGGTMTPTLLGRAAQRVSPNLYSRYGSTESGLLAMGRVNAPGLAANCAGRVPPWVEAQAVDEAGNPLAPGATGQLRFRGPEIAEGYHEDPQASALRFRDGWFYPGDVGRVEPDRLLYLDGRADDMINVAGVKMNPLDIEAVLAECAGVVDAAALAGVAPSGRSFLMAAVQTGEGFDEAAVLAHCRERLGRRAPVRLVQVPGLPRNAMGKLMRGELARRIRITRPGGDAQAGKPA
ncbi:MAG TPA: class I adenylate-forming enzyme family protein [Quisquiliibacterium sp.]|nr:class I adenylate-forming enzyme family protein [Quisquiliibacterium sp.]